MPVEKSPPPADPSDEGLAPRTAPESETRASFGVDDPLATETFTPPADANTPAKVTRTMLNRFLGLKATQDRILEVVLARTKGRAARSDVDDIVQKVNEKALTTSALPKTADRMRPWVSTVAQNAVTDHFRAKKAEQEDLDRGVAVDDLPVDEAMAGTDSDLAFASDDDDRVKLGKLDGWLDARVTTKADRMTLEMIRLKAKADLSNAELAAEFGMTEGAFDQRLRRFKSKWVPAWKKEVARRRRLMALGVLVLLLLAAVALAWLIRGWPRASAPEMPRALPPPSWSAPSAPATAAPTTFEPAAPTPVPVPADPRNEKTAPQRRGAPEK